MHQQTIQIVVASYDILSRKEQIEGAIRDGVTSLAELIETHMRTSREFCRQEAAQSIGEAAPGLEKGRKAAADARSALDQASLKLNGLRTALGQMGSSLVENYEVLSTELPGHFAAITSSFSEEWHCALTAWNLALGRRRALEALLDQELDLPEPVPAPVTLSADTTRPSETLFSLEKAIKNIAGGKALAERQ